MITFLKKKQIFILYLLSFFSIFSFANTVKKSLLNGCDFQWQPSVLFWKGINHYEKFIANGKGDFLCQNGEYAHLLHVIYFPYTLFEWEFARALWLLTNIIFVFLIPFIICKIFKISGYKKLLLFIIFITCYPTRMTLNYGQQSLFVLFFMILPFIFKSKWSIFFSGFSSVKYNSGYVIFLNFISKKEYKSLFISLIPYFIGWIIYFNFTNSNPIQNFFEPIYLSIKKGYIKDSDLYSLINIYLLRNNIIYYKFFFITLIFLVNFFLLKKINKNNDIFFQLSLVSTCPLIFFPHSNYDYVLLFPLLSYSILNYQNLINKINIYFILYIFYLNRIIKHLLNVDSFYQPFMFFLLFSIIILNLYSYNQKQKLFFFNTRLN
jgi:hypothetical protein